jgi:hypothetical protein
MKTFLATLFFAFQGFAVDLTIVNHTGDLVQVKYLFNRCDGNLIAEDNPYYLQPNEEVTFSNITPIMHHYTICGSGYCSSTAMPIQDDIHYFLKVVLIDGFLIDGEPTPDHWVGNIKCPGEE